MLSVHDIKLKVKGIRTTYTKELRILTAHRKLGKPYEPKLFWFDKANSFLKSVCVSRRKKQLNPKEEDPSLTDVQSDCKDFTLDYADDAAYSCEEFIGESESVDAEQAEMVDAEDFKTFIRVVKQADVQEYDIKENHTIVEHSYHEEQCTDSTRSNSNSRQEIVSNTYDDAPPQTSSSAAYKQYKEDEFDLFCRSVAIQLRSLPDSYSRSMAKLKIQQILFEAETGHYKNSACISIPILCNK